MKIGEQKHGFVLIDKQEVESMGLFAHRFLHTKSGAELLWLENQDENRAFSISFKTLPENSTGVFHILEHSVLCGSKKYPLREPFVDLLKGSMQTFLNAMTFPDKTMYPVASTNEKDFMNLVDVYLSSVFEPLIYEKEEIFMQEGWHWEPATKEGELPRITGVVYNEMKGSYSSPDSCMHRELISQMFPDTPYRYSSGGNPPYIPDLTYEDFLENHRRFYHPDNSYLFLYGKLDIEQMLAYLSQAYLDRYEKRGIAFDIPVQAPIGDLTVSQEFEISAEDPIQGNTMIGRATALCSFDNTKDILGMRILLDALTSTNTAPLKSAILEAGLGDNFLAWVDDGLHQPFVTFLLKKTDAEKQEQFISVLYNALNTISKEGIERDLLEGQLNSLEFSLREMDLGAAPGVMLAMMTMDTWLYGGDPVNALRQAELIRVLREEMAEGYFENLICKYLLDKSHAVTLVMTPSKTLGDERLKVEQARAVAYGNGLDADALKNHAMKLERLAEYQATEDSPEARATLPHLERGDMRRDIITTDVTIKPVGDIVTREYVLPTNGIGYLSLYFGCDCYSDEDAQYLSLLGQLLFDLPTKKHTSLAYRNLQLLKLGNLTADLDGYMPTSEKTYHPMFRVSCSFFEEHLEHALAIIQEGLFETVFQLDELKQNIRQEYMSMEMSMVNRGHTYASYRAASGLRDNYRYFDLTEGIEYYYFLKELCSRLDTDAQGVADRLSGLLASILNADALTVSLTGSASLISKYENTPFHFDKAEKREKCVGSTSATTIKHGQKIAGGVAYNALAIDVDAVGLPYNGATLVLQKILSLDYLWNKVRVQGGAYGANARFTLEGLAIFSTYRDPHVKRTYDAYRSVCEYLEQFEASEEDMTKYIIGVFSTLDAPEKPKDTAAMCDRRYFCGITDEERQTRRNEVLAVTTNDIVSAASQLRVAMNEHFGMCTVGAADMVESHRDLFDTIQ